MSQQLLNRAQVRAGLKQVGRERVPQRVRTDALIDRRFAGVATDDPIHAPRRQPAATEIDEEGLTRARRVAVRRDERRRLPIGPRAG